MHFKLINRTVCMRPIYLIQTLKSEDLNFDMIILDCTFLRQKLYKTVEVVAQCY